MTYVMTLKHVAWMLFGTDCQTIIDVNVKCDYRSIGIVITDCFAYFDATHCYANTDFSSLLFPPPPLVSGGDRCVRVRPLE